MNRVVGILLLFWFASQHTFAQILVMSMDEVEPTTSWSIQEKENKYQIENQSGRVLFSGLDSIIKAPEGDEYILVKDNKKGVMSAGGHLFIPIQYDAVKLAYNWFWLVERENKMGVYSIASEHREIVPCTYDSIKLTYTMFNASFIVKANGKWGICNDKGQVYLPIIYDEVEKAASCYELQKDGITSCLFNEKIVVDSIRLKQIIRVTSKDGFSSNYYYLVQKDERKGVLDDNGKLTVPYQYDDIQYRGIWQLPEDNKHIPNNLLLVCKDGLWGMNDLNNKEILPVKYTDIKVLDKGDVILSYEGKVRHYNLVTGKYKD